VPGAPARQTSASTPSPLCILQKVVLIIFLISFFFFFETKKWKIEIKNYYFAEEG
jgi:hypothetical protein